MIASWIKPKWFKDFLFFAHVLLFVQCRSAVCIYCITMYIRKKTKTCRSLIALNNTDLLDVYLKENLRVNFFSFQRHLAEKTTLKFGHLNYIKTYIALYVYAANFSTFFRQWLIFNPINIYGRKKSMKQDQFLIMIEILYSTIHAPVKGRKVGHLAF